MSNESAPRCMSHKDLRNIQTWLDYMLLYRNETKAKIIRILETWTDTKFAEWYKSIADSKEQQIEPPQEDLWVTMSYDQFALFAYGTTQHDTVKECVDELLAIGHIQRRPHPQFPYGPPQYLLMRAVVQKALDDLVIPVNLFDLAGIFISPRKKHTPLEKSPQGRGKKPGTPPGKIPPGRGENSHPSNNYSKNPNNHQSNNGDSVYGATCIDDESANESAIEDDRRYEGKDTSDFTDVQSPHTHLSQMTRDVLLIQLTLYQHEQLDYRYDHLHIAGKDGKCCLACEHEASLYVIDDDEQREVKPITDKHKVINLTALSQDDLEVEETVKDITGHHRPFSVTADTNETVYSYSQNGYEPASQPVPAIANGYTNQSQQGETHHEPDTDHRPPNTGNYHPDNTSPALAHDRQRVEAVVGDNAYDCTDTDGEAARLCNLTGGTTGRSDTPRPAAIAQGDASHDPAHRPAVVSHPDAGIGDSGSVATLARAQPSLGGDDATPVDIPRADAGDTGDNGDDRSPVRVASPGAQTVLTQQTHSDVQRVDPVSSRGEQTQGGATTPTPQVSESRAPDLILTSYRQVEKNGVRSATFDEIVQAQNAAHEQIARSSSGESERQYTTPEAWEMARDTFAQGLRAVWDASDATLRKQHMSRFTTYRAAMLRAWEATHPKPAKQRPGATEKPALTPDGRLLYLAWCSLFHVAIPEHPAIITSANELYQPISQWADILHMTLQEVLKAIMDREWENDKERGYYKGRGVKLYDVKRGFEGWQSVQERKLQAAKGSGKAPDTLAPPSGTSEYGGRPRKDFTGLGKAVRQAAQR